MTTERRRLLGRALLAPMIAGCACFPAQAEVATPGGPRSIAALRPGHLVWGWDDRAVVRVVREVTVGWSAVLVTVRTDDHVLVATPGHRIFDAAASGWGPASLQPGARVRAVTVPASPIRHRSRCGT